MLRLGFTRDGVEPFSAGCVKVVHSVSNLLGKQKSVEYMPVRYGKFAGFSC
jgi:hypothetical protein